ncbi:MAG: xanthine dehydrogenase family protein subunit M [Candidatus Rokubacteria bacterium]|nr:xanthine dehydrogenase family protein subunit M [Candidatus Rokubacteria bacterium]
MSRFEFHAPTSTAEAVELAGRLGESARFLAGGTDLLIQIERGRLSTAHVIGLHRVPGLDTVAVNGRVVLGAAVTHRTIEKTPAFQAALRALVEGAEVIGGHQVRNVATVGGNVVNASPAADLVPVLLAFDAEVTLAGGRGERTVPLARFLVGPGRTDRRPDELLVRIAFAAPPARTGTAFLKAGRRRAMEISVACVAAAVTLDASGERCLDARIALGAVAPTTIRARAAERALVNQPAGAVAFGRAGLLAVEACDPISDVRASAAFRRHLVAVLVPRALARAAERARTV